MFSRNIERVMARPILSIKTNEIPVCPENMVLNKETKLKLKWSDNKMKICNENFVNHLRLNNSFKLNLTQLIIVSFEIPAKI